MAQSEAIRFAGDVNIGKIEIISANGFGTDVANQVIALEFYEDMFSPFLSGVLALRESLDFTNLFPFTGEEYVNINITTPTFTDKNKIINDQFYIYKMTNKIMHSDRSVIYELHFFSREALVDLNKKVSRAYQGKISDIAKQVLTDKTHGLETVKPLNIEETRNVVKFISNWWSPVENLNYAAETAINPNGAASYLFFENRDGFNFTSVEKLYEGAIIQDFIYDSYMRDFLPDGRSIRNIEEEYKRIIEISIPTVYDYVDRTMMGMFASKKTSYDITTKKFTVKNYDMFDDFDKQKHLNKYAPVSQKNIRRYPALGINYPKYYGNFNNFTDVTNSDTVQKRASVLQQMKATTIEILVPGRTDYTVGKIVNVKLNKFDPIKKTDPNEEVIDKMFSGNYIISAISHSVDREKHQCRIELMKDSFMVDFDKGGA